MTYGTRTDGYPSTSKLLHWLIAACVLTTAPVAIAMLRVDKGPTQDALYNLHKSLGVLILILMVLRLINRLIVGAPLPDPNIEPWQKTVSSAVHGFPSPSQLQANIWLINALLIVPAVLVYLELPLRADFSEKAESAYKRCFAQRAPLQPSFADATKQAQAMLAAAMGR